MTPPERRVWDALSRLNDPEIRRPLTELGMVTRVHIGDDGVPEVTVQLTIAGCPAAHTIESEVALAAAAAADTAEARVTVEVMDASERAAFLERIQAGKPAMQFGPDSLTRVITVTSGKGGVGKSSLTAALAVELAQRGLAVGLIDADVFGFSIPGILGLSRDGVTTSPTRIDDMILPPVVHGVKVISIGMFLGEDDPRTTAVSWRGPMLHRTIEQFLRDVWFGDLDVLLLDLPPGTGDIAISVGQLLPQAEVLVVTTPQEAAADVAVRSAVLARSSGQRVLGVIENMSGLVTPEGTSIDLFGSGGGALVAERLNALHTPPAREPGAASHPDAPAPARPARSPRVEVLGHIPLSPAFRAAGDAGSPAMLRLPDDPAVQEIRRVVDRILTLGHGRFLRQSLPLTPAR